MADEAQNIAQNPPAKPVEEEAVVVTGVPEAEKTDKVVGKESPLPENEEKPLKDEKPVEEATTEVLKSNPVESNDEKISQSGSFREESTKVSDLSENERKALGELKQLVQEAIHKHEFSSESSRSPQPKVESKAVVSEAEEEKKKETAEDEKKPMEAVASDDSKKESEEPIKDEAESKDGEEVKEKTTLSVVIEEKKVADSTDDDGAKTVEAIEETIVSVVSNVPLEEQPKGLEENKAVSEEAEPKEPKEPKEEALEAKTPPEEVSIWGITLLADERSDVVLLKFLRARDFKVKDAFFMLKNTVRWRKQFGIDELVNEDLGNDLDKVVFMHGVDKEGHPVCYNVFGEFQNKELYQKTFSDDEKRQKFLRWRIQFLERSIRKLDFIPGGISTIVQVNDLKNSPGPGKWELRQATKQALHLLQDNYPEFVAKQVFINVPWWYLAVNKMISPFLTQRTKSKFVFAGPSKSPETLLRYIAAEQLAVKYGGLSKNGEFDTTDAVTEINIRPAAKHAIEFPVTETCLLTWEVRVVGWEVKYGAEFVPSAEDSYTVIIQKARKVGSTEEPVVCDSFKVCESGKVVLTIDNPTSKKKKLLYRLKTKSSSD